MVGRSVGDGRIGGGGFCCAKLVVGGPAYEWVPKDGSTVSGLTTIVGGCGGCGGWRRLCFDFGGFLFFLYLFIIFIRWCWWMWVCAGGGCRRCCNQGGCAVVDDDDDGEVV